MWENIAEGILPQMTTWRMRMACWIPKATHTHNQHMYYVLLLHCNNGWKNVFSLMFYMSCLSCCNLELFFIYVAIVMIY